MSTAQIVWLALLVTFVLVEAATVSLVSVWFIAGSLCALIAASLGASAVWQAALFLVVSGVLLALLRPLVKKWVHPKLTRTNADRIIGTTALVTETVDNLHGTGAVRVGDITWTAKSVTGEIIPVDTRITIQKLEGAKVYVTPEVCPAEIS